ncbi:MAG TPA: hypothetical protein VMU72_08875 [Gaiellaceae bacterium]|nr:hypothetical protein [Gaiellaceae bacterium]
MRQLLRRPAVQTLAPLLLYTVFAAIWMGRGVLVHPATRVLGDAGRDKTILMWSFLWWPHAIAHAHDPFVANAIWAPHGVNLAWVTSSPTLSFALAPLSETLGPVFAYNVAALAAPPLAAWTAFLLARRLTGSVSASFVAGFLFGFSPYVIGQSVGHLNLSFVCLVPLAGLLAVRFFEGSLGPRRFTVLLALVLVLEFGVSTEIFATATLFTLVVFVLAFFLLDARARLAALARYTTLAYLAAGVVVTPYLVNAFAYAPAPPRPLTFRHTLDLANIVFPTETTWLRPPHSAAITSTLRGGVAELGGYLGAPLLLILLLALVRQRGHRVRRGLWLLVLAALAADLLATGAEMTVAGHGIGPGMWRLIRWLPALGEAIPVRLTMYAVLFAALATALWLAQPGRRPWRFVLAGVAVASFLPTPSVAFWRSRVPQPRFFSTPVYRTFIRPGDTALVFPYAERRSWSMLWQAETGFRFSMVGGHVGQTVIPAECRWAGAYESLSGGTPPGGAAGFRAFLLAHHVTVIVVAPGTGTWSKKLIASSLPDVRPVSVADVKVYRLRPGLPSTLPAGAPSLPQRRLRTYLGRGVCGPAPRPTGPAGPAGPAGSPGARLPRPHG